MPYATIIILTVVIYAGYWRIYEKMGQPGWISLIPIYNSAVLLHVLKRPAGWLVLLLLPGINLIFSVILLRDLLQCFGKPEWHILFFVFLPFIYIPYLGFSETPFRERRQR